MAPLGFESLELAHRDVGTLAQFRTGTNKQLLTQLRQTRAAPQCQRQVHIAELPRAFDPDPFQAHRHAQMTAAVVEQAPLLGRTEQRACKRLRL